MRASFIHIADTHLGYEQYGVRERFNDFSRAFWAITTDAVERGVDFVVIAGDLFNKRAIDAQTLIHAIEGLRRLKEAGIVFIAIQRKDDRHYFLDGTAWVSIFFFKGYFIALCPLIRGRFPLLNSHRPRPIRWLPA